MKGREMRILTKKKLQGVVLAGLAGVLPAAVAAQPASEIAGATLVCLFSTECYEQEECTFAQFTVDVSTDADLPGEAALLPDGDPAEGAALDRDGTLVISATGTGGAYLFSRDPNSSARLSVHFGDPLQVITYHGRCDVAE
jgi:hypothetical protein